MAWVWFLRSIDSTRSPCPCAGVQIPGQALVLYDSTTTVVHSVLPSTVVWYPVLRTNLWDESVALRTHLDPAMLPSFLHVWMYQNKSGRRDVYLLSTIVMEKDPALSRVSRLQGPTRQYILVVKRALSRGYVLSRHVQSGGTHWIDACK